MRASTNISLKERRTLHLSDFRGVDFSSSPLRVQSNRAMSMKNFINEYGVNKKRNGWNEVFRIEKDGVPQRINGVFQYINGERKELIVHAGRRFYRVASDFSTYEDITFSSTYITAKVNASALKDCRSQAFINGGKMYIAGCGDYLVYGSWDGGKTYELHRVADNTGTYIPTTTINIDDMSNAADTRGSLDAVNLLSSKRRNTLVGTAVDKSKKFSGWWKLDASIDEGTLVNIRVEKGHYQEGTNELVSDIIEIENCSPVTGFISDELYLTSSRHDEKIVGSLVLSKGARIGVAITELDTTPPIEGMANITVEFYHKVNGAAERIANCSFGTLFGINGEDDRLFLSGNSDYPNIDFFSEMDDFTYFGDQNTAAIGSSSSAINGYARLSDGTLAIFKEDIGQESTIFYRTGSWQEVNDAQGDQILQAIFPRKAGSMGEGLVSRYACANLSGDPLMLSQNGVFGIVLANNVATTERYTRERSRSINEKLRKHPDLSEAVGMVYKNKYYLAIDGVCYVADSRYKYTAEDDINGSYNYEWWYWDNIPARVWAVLGGKLYFGCADGRICVFDDKYTDRTYQTSKVGDLSLDISERKFIYNENIDISLAENDAITIMTPGLYALLFDDCKVEEGRILVSEECIFEIHDGMEVYADSEGNISDCGLSVNTKYVICNLDKGLCTFQLADENDNVVEIIGGGFRLHRAISQKEVCLTNITDGTFQLKWYNSDKPIMLSAYKGVALPSMPVARFTHEENVVAAWYSAIFDCGTNESSKTLLKLTISTEPEINGRLSFGYETKSVNKLINAKGINMFSFDNLSFENFSFDTGFASSYSVKCNERNFNFIIFRFISDNAHNCAVNNFTAVYKINKSNKGVR